MTSASKILSPRNNGRRKVDNEEHFVSMVSECASTRKCVLVRC